MRLINGEDIDTGGSEAKRTREFSTTNIGADGRRDFSSQSDAPAPAQQQAPAEPQTIYGQQVMQVKETAQRVWDDAHREAQRLQDMFESGQLSAEDHYRLSYEQGVKANSAKEAMYQATIQELQYGNQQEQVHKQLEDALGAEVWGKDTRQQTMQDMVDWARSKNLPDDLLMSIDSVDEAKTLYEAFNNERELQNTKLELKAARQMLKKQNAQLKGRRMKQHKDANVGQKNRDTIDQVADLLAMNGHGHTGRKR